MQIFVDLAVLILTKNQLAHFLITLYSWLNHLAYFPSLNCDHNKIYSNLTSGLDTQIQEIKESVELPLTHPEYYEEMGIKPPKGVILHGPPGTGKTLLAKAVANQTSATFLRVVGSELIQKYLVSFFNFQNYFQIY